MALAGFGKRLDLAIYAAGLSRRGFARLMEGSEIPGAGFSTVYGYFSDKGNPPVEFVLEAAKRLGCNFLWLATGEGLVYPEDTPPVKWAEESLRAGVSRKIQTFIPSAFGDAAAVNAAADFAVSLLRKTQGEVLEALNEYTASEEEAAPVIENVATMAVGALATVVGLAHGHLAPATAQSRALTSIARALSELLDAVPDGVVEERRAMGKAINDVEEFHGKEWHEIGSPPADPEPEST
jgi:hypothetical protein